MGNSGENLTKAPSYVFPATFAQRRLWFVEQLQPGGTSYLVPWALRLEGALNPEALFESLNEIVRRHEVLRTTFRFQDGMPVQVVAETLRIPVAILDLSTSATANEQAMALAREEARRPLDLDMGPLVRAQLLRISSNEHLLLLTLHHIIFDGWSRRIFVQELATLYEAFCAGKPSPLAPPKLQYADYSVWQQKALKGKSLERQLTYWKEQLAGAPATLELPTDRPRPAIQSFNGAKTSLSFSKQFSEQLSRFSREQGVTLFMTLLAGFQVLLSRYSRQDDIVVGTPIANRNRAELEEMIGFFANTVVMRARLAEDPTFRALLGQVKESALGAYANQDLPFEKLVEELRPDRNLSQNPLFQVLFSLQNAPRQAFELRGLKVSLIDVGDRSAKFDVSVFLTETSDGIRGRFEYNTDLFDAATIERMVSHYELLLREALHSPDVPVSSFLLLTAEEQSTILGEWNTATTGYSDGACLHDLIEQQAARTPDAIACVQPGEHGEADLFLTYRELNGQANQLAHFLKKLGVRTGDRVAIYLEPSLRTLVGVLGIQKAGGAYMPLDSAYPAKRIRSMLEEIHPRLLITQEPLLASLSLVSIDNVCIDSAWNDIQLERDSNPPRAAGPDNPAYIILNSGSGQTKGAPVPHRTVVNMLGAISKTLQMDSDDVFHAPASFAFDLCSPGIYLALVTGGRVIVTRRRPDTNSDELSALLRRMGSVQPVPLSPFPRTQALPLSFAQQRLWLLEKLDPRSSLYNLPLILRLKGPLDVSAMRRALNRMVDRHESLRTWFMTKGGTPVQVITPSLELDLGITSVMAVPERVRETEAKRLLMAEVDCPFDLSKGPLVRAMLVRISDADHVLVLSTHHIISDPWSVAVLRDDLAEFYRQEVTGECRELPALPVQYVDYAAWQRQMISGNALNEQLRYWRQKLKGAPPTLELPTDRARPAEQTFRGADFTFEISKPVTEQLLGLGRREGATLFMTLLAAFDILLWRYSGQDDIVVGSTVAGRSRPELEKLVGFLTNTLVLRTRIEGSDTFRQLLAKVRATATGAYAHQDVPFEKLVEELNPERDLSRNPLFQVMFAAQNARSSKQTMGGLEIDRIQEAATTSRFDLTLTATEHESGLHMVFEYATDLFDVDRIERMQRHWVTLLEAIVSNPDCPVAELGLLEQTERQQVLVDWNATTGLSPSTLLHEFVQKQARRTPRAIAVIDGTARVSYSELNGRANQLARKLQSVGVGPEVLVAVCTERCADMIVALLAVLKAGGAYVPLDPMYPKDRLAKILEDSHAKVMITQEPLTSVLPANSAQVLLIDRDWASIATESGADLDVPVTAENLAYVLFTSGSTGRPKGVAIEHRSASIFVQWAQTVFTPEELSGMLFGTSICFDLSIFEMFVPLSVGGAVIIAQNALALSDLPAANEVRLINTVPSAIAELMRMNAVPNTVLTVNLAGEALPESLAREIYERTSVRRLYNLYGPTEDTTYSTYTLVPRTGEVTIGRPIANTQAYILDARRQPVPIGVPGELYLAGDGLARGYYGRDDLTAERFLANPFSQMPNARMYRTGDRCRYRADGTIEYLGRIDNQVKLRGFRIELGEIESLLAQHPAVQQAVVTVREDSPGDKRLVGYIVPKSGHRVGATDARDYLQQSLPDYMVPATLVELDALPLTPNGKVDRKALPRPDLPQGRIGTGVAPRNVLEEKLLAIWKQVLQNPGIGVTDNFFELGGHSLMAARLVSEMEKSLERKIPLAALFRGTSIEAMARVLRDGTESDVDPIVMKVQQGRTAPFFAVVAPGVNPLGYAALARAMGHQQTFYKLQSHRPVRPDAPITLDDMRTIAHDYVAAMRAVQPNGPYFLGGMCAGTHIAEQMVLQLEAAGEKVALFAIFDTWVRQNSQVRWKWLVYYYRQRFLDLIRLSRRRQMRMLRDVLAKKLYRVATLSHPVETSWSKLYWPGKDFQTPRFQAPVALFKRPKQPFYYVKDEAMGWGERSSGGVHIYRIDFPHRMLRDPYVRELASRLLECLSRTTPEPVERLQVWPAISEHRTATFDVEA